MTTSSPGFGVRAMRLLWGATAAAIAVFIGTGGVSADVNPKVTNPKHFFRGVGSPPSPGALTNDLVWHGGNVGTANPIGVERKPAVYLVFWGAQWQSGFTTPDTDGTLHSSAEMQAYVQNFFGNVGGSAWAGTQTQYCRNLPAGATSCKGVAGAQYIGNPSGQLKGVWVDPSPVPDNIIAVGLAENLVDDPIAAEAVKASRHFGRQQDATYMVYTPDQATGTGQPVYCGYHTQTTDVDGLGNPYRVQYAFMPFANHDWGTALGRDACGRHFVNTAPGVGIWDGVSIVGGHEYAEAVTDPDNYLTVQDGWNDAQGSENGDKCAWGPETSNQAFGSYTFAVQAMWSNEAFDAGQDGCQMHRI